MYDRENCKCTNEDIHIHVPLEMRHELSKDERTEQLQQDREWLVQMYTLQRPIYQPLNVLVPLVDQSDMFVDLSSSGSSSSAARSSDTFSS
jgi:hypothetical protein